MALQKTPTYSMVSYQSPGPPVQYISIQILTNNLGQAVTQANAQLLALVGPILQPTFVLVQKSVLEQ